MGALDEALKMMGAGLSPAQQAVTDPGQSFGTIPKPEPTPTPAPQQLPGGEVPVQEQSAPVPAPAPQMIPSGNAQVPDGTADRPLPMPDPTPSSRLGQALMQMPKGPSGAEPGELGSPFNTSPLSAGERWRLAFGNNAGKIDFLKKKFEDVVINEEQGILLRKAGKWYKADPSLFGDGPFSDKVYEFAKDVADLGDLIPTGVGQVVGGAVGGMLGAQAGLAAGMAGSAPAAPGTLGASVPAGAIAGAYIGGAAGLAVGEAAGAMVGGGVRNYLGRVYGTYEPPPPSDEIKELALDGMYALGGRAIALGAKPTYNALVDSLKWVGEKAPRAVKDMLAVVYGKTTGAGTAGMETLWANPGKIVHGVRNYLGEAGGNSKAAAQLAKDDAVQEMKSFLEEGAAALPRKWRDMVSTLIESPQTRERVAKLDVDMEEVFLEAGKTMEKAGFGRLVPIEAPDAVEKTGKTVRKYYDKNGVLRRIYETEKNATQRVTEEGTQTVANEMTEISGRTAAKAPLGPMGSSTSQAETASTKGAFQGGFRFQPFSGEEIAARAGAGEQARAMTAKTVDEVNEIVHQLSELARGAGKVRGKSAANTLVQYNTLLNDLNRVAREQGGRTLQTVVDQISTGFRQQVGQEFEKVGLAGEYTALSGVYQRYANSVDEGRRLLNLPAGNGPELALERISSEAAKNARTRTVVQGNKYQGGLAELVPDGAARLQRIAELDAVRKFIPIINPVWNVSTAAAGGALAGTAHLAGGAAAKVIGGASIPMFMPRAVAYGSAGVQAAAGLTNEVAAKAMPYMRMGTDFLKRLTPKQMREFMQNEEAVRAFIAPMSAGVLREEQMTKELITESGALQ